MEHTHINLESTGAFLRVTPEHLEAYGLAAQLITILQPPLGAPFAPDIVKLLVSAITFAIEKLVDPTLEAIRIKKNFSDLAWVIANAQDPLTKSSRLSLRGKASSHPVWYQLAQATQQTSSSGPLLLYVASAVLLALHHEAAIPRIAAQHLQQVTALNLSDAALDALLSGFAPQELLGSSWTSRLARMWRKVVKLYSDGEIPPPTLESRIAGQLLGSALNPSPAHVAGAQSHTQLSHRQFVASAVQLKDHGDRDELNVLLGALTIRTGLQVDVITQLPLASGRPGNAGAYLDPTKGILHIDLHPLVFEPARALPGCDIGGFSLCIHLPSCIARHLRNRSGRFPSAACLMDLFPGEKEIFTREDVYASMEEINPSWARLRRSTGPMLLHANFNALHAALLSMDFSLVCRSKMHYALVSADEWHAAEARLYKLLNWDTPVEAATDESGIGSRVVPTDLTVVQHDTALLQAMQTCNPGKHSSLERLMDFHNHYTFLTGWRLSVLLALRASSELALSASLGDWRGWVPVRDKSTRNDLGHQPVPVCDFALQSIHHYRNHCAAMADRLANLSMGNRPSARWCKAVSQGKNQRLLCTLTSVGTVHALASHTFCKPAASIYALPADPGRKVLENALRAEGLPATLIDQMLRHSHAGQIHLSNFNLSPMATSMERLRAGIQRVAERLFLEPVAGLRKE